MKTKFSISQVKLGLFNLSLLIAIQTSAQTTIEGGLYINWGTKKVDVLECPDYDNLCYKFYVPNSFYQYDAIKFSIEYKIQNTKYWEALITDQAYGISYFKNHMKNGVWRETLIPSIDESRYHRELSLPIVGVGILNKENIHHLTRKKVTEDREIILWVTGRKIVDYKYVTEVIENQVITKKEPIIEWFDIGKSEPLRIKYIPKNPDELSKDCYEDYNGEKEYLDNRMENTNAQIDVQSSGQSEEESSTEPQPYISKNSKGITVVEGQMLNGQKEGLWIQYFDDGAINEETNYKNGQKDGLYTLWDQDGNKQCEREFKLGQKEGKQIQYWKNGEIKREYTKTDGELNGVDKEYNDDGILVFECHYDAGETVGTKKSYFDSGEISYETNYKSGKMSGIHKKWRRGGKLAEEGQYVSGRKTGHWKYYNTYGLSSEGGYTEGKKDGAWKEYDRNGKLEEEVYYDLGKKL